MSTTTADHNTIVIGKTFVWHELYAPDNKAAAEFYVNALGFETEDYPMGDGFTYKMLTREGTPVAGVMGTDTPDMSHVPPHWATYISVDDVDGRLAKCLELGAKTVVEPMDVPNVGRMVLIEDPSGAHVWLFKSASS